jgi:hypothetical protein
MTRTHYAGRWAGDPIYLVGDYDSSKLYDKARAHYTNIAKRLVDEYNRFIRMESQQLHYAPPAR